MSRPGLGVVALPLNKRGHGPQQTTPAHTPADSRIVGRGACDGFPTHSFECFIQ